MKSLLKNTIAALLCTTCLYVSCKKNATAPAKSAATVNTADLSKQILSNIYLSLSNNFKTSNGLKPNAVKGSITLMDNNNGCGEVVVTPTNNTVVSGDTTRTYLGNSIFTYLCNGYFNNSYNVDAYTLSDTLKTKETGTGFANSYYVTLNYLVKAADSQYQNVTINGTTSTSSHVSKVSAAVITEYHDISTAYNLGIAAQRTTGNPVIFLGRIDFSTTTADKDPINFPAGTSAAYSGFIFFSPDNTATLNFLLPDGSYKVYSENLTTGVITAL